MTLSMCRYLGLFTDEIEAAEAYDRASVEIKGLKAVTNFDISRYLDLLSKSAKAESDHDEALQFCCSSTFY